MNAALVVATALVMPLCFGGRWWPWLVATLGVVVSLWFSEGWAAGLVLLPWVVALVAQLVRARSLLDVVTVGFGLVSAGALIMSRLELTLFGILEPIVKLTALHFSYAGVGTLTLARRLLALRPAARTQRVTIGLVVAAPVVVALGFIARSSVGQVGGALLMTAGTWLVASLNFTQVRALRSTVAQGLMVISSLSPWASMMLAISWAANNYWPQVPALTVVDMVPTHGALNAFGFVACALLAWRSAKAVVVTV